MGSKDLAAFKAGLKAAKNNSGTRKKRKMTLPLATIGGLAVGLWPTAEALLAGQPGIAMIRFARGWFGFDPVSKTWDPRRMMEGVGPALMGGAVSYGASKIGINRRLGQAQIPLLRI